MLPFHRIITFVFFNSIHTTFAAEYFKGLFSMMGRSIGIIRVENPTPAARSALYNQ